MPRSLELSLESPATVEQLHSTFRDENYWLERVAASGGVARLDSFIVGPDGSVDVTTVLDLRRDMLPGFVASRYPRDLALLHKESWIAIESGRVRGSLRFDVQGAPGSGLGEALLTPAQPGSRLKLSGSVEFRIPLIGGTIERLVKDHLAQGLTDRFTTEWIASND